MQYGKSFSGFYLPPLLLSIFLASLASIPGSDLIVSFASADTIPSGDVSGTWTMAGSPYYINGDINVPAGQLLTIEPGVVLDFLGYYKLTVYGQLEAIE